MLFKLKKKIDIGKTEIQGQELIIFKILYGNEASPIGIV